MHTTRRTFMLGTDAGRGPLHRLTLLAPLLLLFSGCVPFTSLDPRHEQPFFTFKTRTRSVQSEAAPDEQRLQAVKGALDAEQAYIDMLAEYATGRIPLGRGLVAGGPVFSGPLPAGAMSDAVQPFLGIPYKWGGVTPQGMDCSGFTMLVYKRFGVNLPHSSVGQAQMGSPVGKQELQAGDLVFFAVGNKLVIDHVGVMVSRDLMAHCSGLRGRVVVEPLARIYPTSFAGARRLSGASASLGQKPLARN